ncbi:phage tail terminator protein [Conchiformibius steedae]|uniref:DUF1834 family protein n=1 Tax=Conchiformibius steedae TaxID=153493 RepID=A0A3P2A0W6_9NEIS|nr:hypothetical protein [Conchiformibius steedae]RRD89054.1 hypothetical protein EII21_10155 [Conchiformibius steedae]
MNHNMLAIYPVLLEQVRQVQGVYAVQGVRELAQMLDDNSIRPVDGTLYAVFDGWLPLADGVKAKQQKRKRLSFSLILAKQFYGAEDVPHEQPDVGELLARICGALQGWHPRDDAGRPLTAAPFDEVQAAPIQFFDNFALYPMRFETEIISNYTGV